MSGLSATGDSNPVEESVPQFDPSAYLREISTILAQVEQARKDSTRYRNLYAQEQKKNETLIRMYQELERRYTELKMSRTLSGD